MKKAAPYAALAVCLLLLAAAAHAQFPRKPTAAPAPRGYLCFEGKNADDITRKANEAGTRGWKMVAAAAHRTGSVWCFEQLIAARPSAD